MAKAINTLSIKLDLGGLAGGQALIDKLKSSFKGLEQVISGNTAPAIRKLRQQVNDFAAQGNKSISTIEGQVTALRALRREADINSKEFKELTADIKKYEAQLRKTQGRPGGGGGGALRATQTAGAVISGGIFGGPEGAIGGLLGAPFGVSGAFAGAAIGAQVGGLRQGIGGAATYAADISKLKIALEGVVGPGKNFASAIEAAGEATRDLNVPQREAIRGITRLSAAVVGAGGPVSDAELTFKNVASAIKATGGNSEDVQGAITAMVQVFSKGKVSAEELSGQLGERLPGAVTMFAKANKMTLPELQKALKAGTVGLNELMNFIVELGNKYGDTAGKMASSNEEAGARLQIAFNQMKLEVGQALVETGAGLQNAFTKFIIEITPAVVSATKALVKAFTAVAKNLDIVIASVGTFAAVLVGGKLVLGIKALTVAIAGLTGVMAINPLLAGAAAAAGVVAGIMAINNALNGTARELQNIAKLSAGQTFAGLSNVERQAKISANQSVIASNRAELRKLERDFPTEAAVPFAEVRKKELRDQIAQGEERLRRLTAPVKRDQPQRTFQYDPVATVPGGGSSAKAKGPVDISITELNIRKEILEARKQEDLILAANLQHQLDVYQALKNNKGENDLALKTLEAREKLESTLASLAEKDLERVNKKLDLEKQLNQELRNSLEDRQYQLGLISEEQNIENQIRREREALEAKGASSEQIKQQTDLLRKILSETPIDKFIRDAEKSLADLQTRAVTVAQAIGDSIGQALSNGIQSLIEGTSNIKEQFANLLKSIGQILIQEGTKMIATYIAIGIAKAFAFGSKNVFGEGPNLFGQDFTGAFMAGAFGTRATGGPVQGGRPYIVGERGPELFMPSQSGQISSNEDMRRLMGRSPLGGAAQMNFTFETTNIGGTEYVSREQLELAMATTRRQAANDGAQRGMSMTLDRMQNSPRTRSRLGIA